MNQFGTHIKLLREQKGLLQGHVAGKLDIDTPMLSKTERGGRSAKSEQVGILSKNFKVQVDELLSLWLADKVYEVVKNEKVALMALSVIEKELNLIKK